MKNIYAEREGFEPPVPFGTMVFKTTAFDHSAISPAERKCKIFLADKPNNNNTFSAFFNTTESLYI